MPSPLPAFWNTTPALAGVTGLGVLTLTTLAFALGRHHPARRDDHETNPGLSGTGGGVTPGGPAGARRVRAVETALTVSAAGIATAVAISGMWRVFGDALGFNGPARIALAGFLEIALMVSAIRARASLRDRGTVGVDGAAVWALAALSSVLAATDAQGLGRAVRFAAPLVAAWLWERGLAAERRRSSPTRRQAVVWRWTRARLAIALGLAEATDRTLSDLDRARRLRRLTRARLHLAILEGPTPRLLAWITLRPARTAWATWRLQHHALAAVEHLRLGTDPAIATTIRTTVAAVTGLRAATAPGTLLDASPWTTPPAGRDQASGLDHVDTHLPEAGPRRAPQTTGPDSDLTGRRRSAPGAGPYLTDRAHRPSPGGPGTSSTPVQAYGPVRAVAALGPRTQVLAHHAGGPAHMGTGPDRERPGPDRLVSEPTAQVNGTGPDRSRDDARLATARKIAASVQANGHSLSRARLLAELRQAGHTCSTDRASALLVALREAGPHHGTDPDTSTWTGPVTGPTTAGLDLASAGPDLNGPSPNLIGAGPDLNGRGPDDLARQGTAVTVPDLP